MKICLTAIMFGLCAVCVPASMAGNAGKPEGEQLCVPPQGTEVFCVDTNQGWEVTLSMIKPEFENLSVRWRISRDNRPVLSFSGPTLTAEMTSWGCAWNFGNHKYSAGAIIFVDASEIKPGSAGGSASIYVKETGAGKLNSVGIDCRVTIPGPNAVN